jgi:hypothetical protein
MPLETFRNVGCGHGAIERHSGAECTAYKVLNGVLAVV